MERFIEGYSDKMPLSSQVQMVVDLSKRDISLKLNSIHSILNEVISEVTDKPLIDQVFDMVEDLNCEAYQTVVQRNPALNLSSNQLHTLVDGLGKEMKGREEIYSSNHETHSSVVNSLFNSLASTMLNPSLRDDSPERQAAAEELLKDWMRQGKV